MPLTNAGRDLIAKMLIGESHTPLNNANAYLGVGNGTAAFSAAQTDLQGASKTRKAMDGGYPTRSSNVLTFRSTFGTGEANHAWEEFGGFNANSGGDMAFRKVQALGTKTSAQTWQLTVDATVTAA